MTARIIIDIMLLLAIFLLPPIFPLIIVLFFSYYFESFYEIIFAGLIIDALYSRPMANFYFFSYPMTFIAVVLFISSIFIKKKLKFYSNK